MGLAGILVLIANPALAAANPKADFKVLSVKVQNPTPTEPLHMFDHSADTLLVRIRVKNVGDAAGRGHGVVKILGDGQLSPTKLEFPIARLKPGRTRVVVQEIIGHELGGTNDYQTKACANARRDARAGNNCHRGPNFAVIPFKWKGTTDSVVNDNGIVSTCDGDVTFTYNHPASGSGRFVYRAGGFVNCTASGSQGSCNYSGGGQDVSIEQFLTILQISSSLDSYNAVGASTKTYEALKECPPDPPEVVNLDVAAWLTTGNFGMDPSDITLHGSLPLAGDTFSWNLTAAD